VAERVDLLFITAVDGRTHLDLFRRTIAARRPTFIDKPMTTSLAEAKEIFSLGEQHHVPVMSCSSLRYSETLTKALADESAGEISGVDVFGPVDLQPALPGLFWYGIHSVEIVNRVMGRGCREVRATKTDDHDAIACTFADGRVATLHGLRDTHHKFGATVHRKKGFQFVDAGAGKRGAYALMLEAILRSLPAGKSDVAPADTLEIIRLIEAANESRESGKAVAL
jgi:predicted dehydrogenase